MRATCLEPKSDHSSSCGALQKDFFQVIVISLLVAAKDRSHCFPFKLKELEKLGPKMKGIGARDPRNNAGITLDSPLASQCPSR